MKTLKITILLVLLSILSVSAQTTQLSSEDAKYWNGFVDYVELKGFKNSTELDKKDKHISENLFNDYNTLNNKNYNYTQFVINIQKALIDYRTQAIIEIISGKALLDGYKLGDTNYDFDHNFMVGLSNIDGWAGSKTTSWKFPSYYIIKHASKIKLGSSDIAKLIF